jgi:hypothetical protein
MALVGAAPDKPMLLKSSISTPFVFEGRIESAA